MFKKYFLLILLPCLNSTFHTSFAMELVSTHYGLSVKKYGDDLFKIKLAKNDTQGLQKGSFVANFNKQIITDKQNLFAPFQTSENFCQFTHSHVTDSFLWNIPGFWFS